MHTGAKRKTLLPVVLPCITNQLSWHYLTIFEARGTQGDAEGRRGEDSRAHGSGSYLGVGVPEPDFQSFP